MTTSILSKSSARKIVSSSSQTKEDSLSPSTLPVKTSNNVKIYNVTGYDHHKLPDWMIKKHSRKLKKDDSFSKRVQLLQDFSFPEASLKVSFTPDERHIIALGVYKPQMRVYDLAEASMKFERHTSVESQAMVILGEDWRKVALLQSNRYVEFHNSSGLYHQVRIPKVGRDMTMDWKSAELLFGATGSEVFRLNLDRGHFMAPLQLKSSTNVNAVKVNEQHGLIALGCDGGVIEFWDRRTRDKGLGGIEVSPTSGSRSTECPSIRSLCYLPNGINIAAGTSDGRVLTFDLRRQNKAISVLDHYNGYPIHKIDYHLQGNNLISSDKRSIKIWKDDASSSSGTSIFTTIESETDIHDFAVQQGTGLIIAANEGSPISSYFIPSLSPAPKWCHFLENMTEEMEENSTTNGSVVYENYQFVTKDELVSLSLDHLIGTNLLMARMHGYYMDVRLYEKAKAIANPFAHDEWVIKQKEAKLEAERESRITSCATKKPKAPKHKVNQKFADKLQKDLELGDDREDQIRKKEHASSIIGDDRFKEMYLDDKFEIDEESEEYRLLHPASTRSMNRSR